MSDLKLPRIPDRTPIRLVIHVLPDLHQALVEYAKLYGQTYGKDETVTELVPVILATFLESDRGFVRWRAALRRGRS